MKKELTAERLRELLAYDLETGVFTRRVAAGGYKVGAVSGCANSDGYVCIRVDKTLYYAHRLAWLYVNGEWPKNLIDHKHGTEAGNGIENLREADAAINQQNRRTSSCHNRSRLLGVSPNRERWSAKIKANGKRLHLGTFDTPDEAHEVYLTAKRELHPGCTL